MQKLTPTLSLFQITFLGIGTMIGAGIYVLVGKVAGISGALSVWAFLAATVIVSFSAYCHGYLAKHIPSSAGAAEYVQQAFNTTLLTQAVGIGVLLTGVVSAATLANGFHGYFSEVVVLPGWLVITVLVAALCYIASRPIKTSVNFAVAITLTELGGILLVIAFADTSAIDYTIPAPTATAGDFQLIIAGAFVAFYAFVGFEDMVNLAEEVKQPERTMLPAVMISLVVTSILYLVTVWVALQSLAIEALASSDAPFAEMLGHTPWLAKMVSLIGLVAIINGALVQILMGSRILFGLSRRDQMPRLFSTLNASDIPITATLFVSALVWLFALALPLLTLAKLTSGIVLIVFTLVNASAFVIARRNKHHLAAVIALMGVVISLAFVVASLQ